jgi:hypothetical protein
MPLRRCFLNYNEFVIRLRGRVVGFVVNLNLFLAGAVSFDDSFVERVGYQSAKRF